MWHIRNLAGELMLKDLPVCEFRVENENVEIYNEHTGVKLPWELRDGITPVSMMTFLLERLPDPNRHMLVEHCKEAGIECTADAILRHSYGLVVDDKYWIRMKNGPQTWIDVNRNAGFDMSEVAEEMHAF